MIGLQPNPCCRAPLAGKEGDFALLPHVAVAAFALAVAFARWLTNPLTRLRAHALAVASKHDARSILLAAGRSS